MSGRWHYWWGKPRPGYWGRVTLSSPDGTRTETVILPCRYRASGSRDLLIGGTRDGDRDQRHTRRFYRHLSGGWTIRHAERGLPPTAAPEQKAPEEIDKVAEATSLSSESVHGGQEATKDVTSSPNAADDGQSVTNRGARHGLGGQDEDASQEASDTPDDAREEVREHQRDSLPRRPRGRRGGRPRRVSSGSQAPDADDMLASRRGGRGLHCRTPLEPSRRTQAAAAASAKLLKGLVGRAVNDTPSGTQVDAERLLLTLETGDNPLPALDVPRKRPRARVLISPDCSGSTQDWSGVGQAWAIAIAGADGLEVVYEENTNGELPEPGDTAQLLAKVDLVVYLGDSDGHVLCHKYANQGATVIALDSYKASWANPRVREDVRTRSGRLLWLDRTSAKDPDTWTAALEHALARL